MLLKKKESRYWIFRTKVNGKTWERSTGEIDRKKAMTKVPELETLAQMLRDSRGVCLTLSAAILREADIAEDELGKDGRYTIENYLTNFARFVGRDLPLDRIDTRLLEEFQRRRLKKAAQSTYNKEVTYVLRMLKRNGFTVIKPKAIRGRKAEHRPFTSDEIYRFFKSCDNITGLPFLVMLFTGARAAEVFPSARQRGKALMKSELTSQGTVRVRNAKLKPGQRATMRSVPIPPELMEELGAYAETTEGPFLFPSRNSSVKNTFDRIIKRAKIDKVDPLGRKVTSHSFRHTFCTALANKVGQNPFMVMNMMGHANITTSAIYCHGDEVELTWEMIVKARADRDQQKDEDQKRLEEQKEKNRIGRRVRASELRQAKRNQKENPHSNPVASGEWGRSVGKAENCQSEQAV